MIRRRPLLGAVAGLLAVALGLSLAPATHAADDAPLTCEGATAPEADVQDGLKFVPVALNAGGDSAEATQPIKFQVTNTVTPQVGREAPKVLSVKATIVGCRDGQALPAPSSNEVGGPAAKTLSMDWTAAFTWNREYDVVIEATGSRPSGLTTAEQHLKVVKRLHLVVPPKKPTGVKTTVANGVVTVAWSNAEREPDLIAYEVRRTIQGSNDYVTVKDGLVQPSVSSVSDLPGEGAYRYQVIAYRPDVDAGAASSDVTAEVPAAAPAGAPSGTGADTARAPSPATGGDSTTASGTSGTTATTARPAITTGGAGGTVDLSHFAAVLNARRSTPTTRVEPPDPGYEETLPFHVAGDEPAVGEPEEVGPDESGLGERLVADPDARRRSLGFVGFGLLLFVLGMTGLFVKGEVKRADELEALEGDADVDLDDGVDVVDEQPAVVDEPPAVIAPLPERRPRRPRRLALLGPDPAELDEFTPAPVNGIEHEDLRDVLGHPPEQPAVVNGTHRRRRTVAPLDAPGLDVPDPAPAPPPTTRTTNARRAASRVPARPADDRRQGRAAVRAGGRGTGEGDRRVPVGR